MKKHTFIFSQQLHLLHKLLLLPLIATLLNASIIVYVLSETQHYQGLIQWLWLNAIVVALRFLIYFKYRSDINKDIDLENFFYWLFFVGTAFSALLWAYLVIAFFPQNELVHQLFIAFIWAGMAAGAVSSLSARFEMYVVYSTILLLPLFILFFLHSEDVSFFMGLTTFIFWIIMLASSWRHYKTTEESFVLVYNNRELLEEVDELNRRLENKLNAAKAEVRHQEAVLFQQSKLASMGEMIGNIAHQWRQPLNILALSIQDIEDAYEYGELNQPYIEKMTTESMNQINYMSKTIDDFSDFIKPNQKMEIINLHQTIEETFGLVSQSFTKHRVECIIQKPAMEAEAIGYKSEFKQVIINLLNNAKDAIVEKDMHEGKINIAIYTHEKEVEITVEDNAGGIPQEVIGRIFEPYFTTKEEGKGTGIGLYMSYTIITDKMSGSLSASNVKNGALFTITLPLAENTIRREQNV